MLFFCIIRQVFLFQNSIMLFLTKQTPLVNTIFYRSTDEEHSGKKNLDSRNYAQRDDSNVQKHEKQQEFLSTAEKQMDTTVLGKCWHCLEKPKCVWFSWYQDGIASSV